jgi:hypothetical protein
MGLFYFHLRYEGHLISDDQGLDLPDVAAARHERYSPPEKFCWKQSDPDT